MQNLIDLCFSIKCDKDTSSKDFQDFIVDVGFIHLIQLLFLRLSYRSSFVVMVTWNEIITFSIIHQILSKTVRYCFLYLLQNTGNGLKLLSLCINLGIRLSTVWYYLTEHLMVLWQAKLTAWNCKQRKLF